MREAAVRASFELVRTGYVERRKLKECAARRCLAASVERQARLTALGKQRGGTGGGGRPPAFLITPCCPELCGSPCRLLRLSGLSSPRPARPLTSRPRGSPALRMLFRPSTSSASRSHGVIAVLLPIGESRCPAAFVRGRLRLEMGWDGPEAQTQAPQHGDSLVVFD